MWALAMVTVLVLSGSWGKERTGRSCAWVSSYSHTPSLHTSFMLPVFASSVTQLIWVWDLAGGLANEEGRTVLSPDAKLLQSRSLPALLWSKHLLDGNQEASCPDACAINKICECVCSCFILSTKVFVLPAKWGHFLWSSQLQKPIWGWWLHFTVVVKNWV